VVSFSEIRLDWRTKAAEPTLRPIVPPAERPKDLIPAERYTSREFANREWNAVWRHSWHLVCRDQDIPDVGDYIEYEIGDQSVLLVRSDAETVKAHYNSCLHRGMQLRKGRGNSSELRCPYHSWCWHLDGSIADVVDPYEYHPDLLTPEALHLPPVRLETWAGFYFVNLDAGAVSLLEHLGALVDELAPFEIEKMVYQSHRRAVLPANWKTVIDNFGETYHIATIHPQSLPFADDVNEIVENVGEHTIMKVPTFQTSERLAEDIDDLTKLKQMLTVLTDLEMIDPAEIEMLQQVEETLSSSSEPDAVKKAVIGYRREKAITLGCPDLTDEQLIEDWDVHIFPNIEINFLFGQVFGYTVRPNGLDPDSCVFEVISLSLPTPGQPIPDCELEVYDDYRECPWPLTLVQDISVFARMQQGLHSETFPGLRFATYRERGLRHTHEVMDEWFAKYEKP
jgi:nitrite reductase/ring-hydroxylating ferredoxin subunit